MMTEEADGFDDGSADEPFQVEITDTLDLHSFHPAEVRAVVNAYLDEVRKLRFGVVRIIHGKGIGVQREIVRKLLAEKDFVRSFKNADELSGGGSGATVVKLKI